MAVLEGRRSTSDQVAFLIKAAYSLCMAESQEGSFKVALVDLGSRWVRRRVGLTLGLTIPDFARVHMGWVFVGLTKAGTVSDEGRLSV